MRQQIEQHAKFPSSEAPRAFAAEHDYRRRLRKPDLATYMWRRSKWGAKSP